MKNSWIVEVGLDFLRLFYPRYCLGCSTALVKGEELICTGCMLELPQTYHYRETDNSLKKRLSARVPLKYAMAFFKFKKNSRVQHLLHALKYKNEPEVGVVLGRVLGQKLKQANYHQEFDLIVPVPLHPTRQRQRGYNQSARFAEGLSEQLGVRYSEHTLVRNVKTESQTRKTKLARWENVSAIFEVREPIHQNARILLVDDVITTGSTVEACCQALLNAGCSEVSVACLAEA